MADERAAYPDSSRRSEQLSCIKLFHPSYRLFYMIFQSLNDFLEFIFNSKIIVKMLDAPRTVYTKCTQ